MTADAAVRGIRSVDEEGTILVLTDEPHPPYDRPPLSKGLWTGDDEERIWRETGDVGARIRTGCRVESMDREAREVQIRGGERVGYERLLLSTGARPRTLNGPAADQVIHFRTLEDFRALRHRVRQGGRLALVGGGFIGCELAGSLIRTSGAESEEYPPPEEMEIHLIYPESLPLERSLPGPFGELLARHLESVGVALHPGWAVSEVGGGPEQLELQVEPAKGTPDAETASLAGDRSRPRPDMPAGFDTVVAGLGVDPRVELAREAGLEVDEGIVVDASLRTADPRVFAAGDVARFPVPFLGGLHRVEHEEHANESGLTAGQAMAGQQVSYEPLPYVYSGVGPLTLEILGLPSPDDQVEAAPPGSPEGVGLARILREGRITGVLIWNRPGRAHRIRRRLLDDDPDPTLDELKQILD